MCGGHGPGLALGVSPSSSWGCMRARSQRAAWSRTSPPSPRGSQARRSVGAASTPRSGRRANPTSSTPGTGTFDPLATAPGRDEPVVVFTTIGWNRDGHDMARVQDVGTGMAAVGISMTAVPGLRSRHSFFFPGIIALDPRPSPSGTTRHPSPPGHTGRPHTSAGWTAIGPPAMPTGRRSRAIPPFAAAGRGTAGTRSPRRGRTGRTRPARRRPPTASACRTRRSCATWRTRGPGWAPTRRRSSPWRDMTLCDRGVSYSRRARATARSLSASRAPHEAGASRRVGSWRSH
jgi:hypothetical protein